MESVQTSPCGFICKRKESWCYQISGWKYGHFETPTTKTDIILVLSSKIKGFLREQLTSDYLST